MADMTTCTQCAEPVAREERFCEACGFDRYVRRGGTAAAAGAQPRCHGCGQQGSGEYCPECGLRYRDGTDRVEVDLGTLAGVSDRGYVHARNEDALALGVRDDDAGEVFGIVVCDGVSSTPGSERASRAATETALDVLLRDPAGEGNGGDVRVREAIGAASRAVAELAASVGADPSCTVVAAYADFSDAARPEVAVGWLGDSRAYWLAEPDAAEQARLLTGDHSWASEMVAAGKLDADTALSDPRAHVITRWLSADDDADVVLLRPTGPGTLLLCSDGLWNYVPDAAGLAALADPAAGGESADEASDSLRTAKALTSVALNAGAHDNVTVAVLPITPRSPT